MTLAIDVVLIPPPEIFNLSLELNARSTKTPVRLGKEINLPHLSLLQAIIEETNIPFAIEKLAAIAQDFKKVPIVIDRLNDNSFNMKNEGKLREIHERVIAEIQPLLSAQAGKQTDYYRPNNEKITDDCFPWVNNFIQNASYDNFDPHITLWMQGNASTHNVTTPISYTNTHIALYHLGPYNTCTKVLWKMNFSK